MENDDGKKNGNGTSSELPAASDAQNNQAKQIGKSRSTSKESDGDKKKSYRRSWRSTSPIRKIEIGALALGAAAGLGYLGVAIWGNLETKWNFTAEHRPRVVLSRAPELLGTVDCNITDKAMYLHAGAMRIWVKDGEHNGDAKDAFVLVTTMKLVPEKPTGTKFFDTPPQIDDRTCNQTFLPQMKEFTINSGTEVATDVRQAGSVQSLIKASSISIDPRQEPQPAAGQDSGHIHLAPDATMQLYMPVCVVYTDEDGTTYASCQDYQMVVDGRANGSDDVGFSCTQTPIHGTFVQTLGNYCQK
jgi:hypothetical protein